MQVAVIAVLLLSSSVSAGSPPRPSDDPGTQPRFRPGNRPPRQIDDESQLLNSASFIPLGDDVPFQDLNESLNLEALVPPPAPPAKISFEAASSQLLDSPLPFDEVIPKIIDSPSKEPSKPRKSRQEIFSFGPPYGYDQGPYGYAAHSPWFNHYARPYHPPLITHTHYLPYQPPYVLSYGPPVAPPYERPPPYNYLPEYVLPSSHYERPYLYGHFDKFQLPPKYDHQEKYTAPIYRPQEVYQLPPKYDPDERIPSNYAREISSIDDAESPIFSKRSFGAPPSPVELGFPSIANWEENWRSSDWEEQFGRKRRDVRKRRRRTPAPSTAEEPVDDMVASASVQSSVVQEQLKRRQSPKDQDSVESRSDSRPSKQDYEGPYVFTQLFGPPYEIGYIRSPIPSRHIYNDYMQFVQSWSAASRDAVDQKQKSNSNTFKRSQSSDPGNKDYQEPAAKEQNYNTKEKYSYRGQEPLSNFERFTNNEPSYNDRAYQQESQTTNPYSDPLYTIPPGYGNQDRSSYVTTENPNYHSPTVSYAAPESEFRPTKFEKVQSYDKSYETTNKIYESYHGYQAPTYKVPATPKVYDAPVTSRPSQPTALYEAPKAYNSPVTSRPVFEAPNPYKPPAYATLTNLYEAPVNYQSPTRNTYQAPPTTLYEPPVTSRPAYRPPPALYELPPSTTPTTLYEPPVPSRPAYQPPPTTLYEAPVNYESPPSAPPATLYEPPITPRPAYQTPPTTLYEPPVNYDFPPPAPPIVLYEPPVSPRPAYQPPPVLYEAPVNNEPPPAPTPPATLYEPPVPSRPAYQPPPVLYEAPVNYEPPPSPTPPPTLYEPPVTSRPAYQPPAPVSYEPPPSAPPTTLYEPPRNVYEAPPTTLYEPPVTSRPTTLYEPPVYEPPPTLYDAPQQAYNPPAANPAPVQEIPKRGFAAYLSPSDYESYVRQSQNPYNPQTEAPKRYVEPPPYETPKRQELVKSGAPNYDRTKAYEEFIAYRSPSYETPSRVVEPPKYQSDNRQPENEYNPNDNIDNGRLPPPTYANKASASYQENPKPVEQVEKKKFFPVIIGRYQVTDSSAFHPKKLETTYHEGGKVQDAHDYVVYYLPYGQPLPVPISKRAATESAPIPRSTWSVKKRMRIKRFADPVETAEDLDISTLSPMQSEEETVTGPSVGEELMENSTEEVPSTTDAPLEFKDPETAAAPVPIVEVNAQEEDDDGAILPVNETVVAEISETASEEEEELNNKFSSPVLLINEAVNETVFEAQEEELNNNFSPVLSGNEGEIGETAFDDKEEELNNKFSAPILSISEAVDEEIGETAFDKKEEELNNKFSPPIPKASPSNNSPTTLESIPSIPTEKDVEWDDFRQNVKKNRNNPSLPNEEGRKLVPDSIKKIAAAKLFGGRVTGDKSQQKEGKDEDDSVGSERRIKMKPKPKTAPETSKRRSRIHRTKRFTYSIDPRARADEIEDLATEAAVSDVEETTGNPLTDDRIASPSVDESSPLSVSQEPSEIISVNNELNPSSDLFLPISEDEEIITEGTPPLEEESNLADRIPNVEEMAPAILTMDAPSFPPLVGPLFSLQDASELAEKVPSLDPVEELQVEEAETPVVEPEFVAQNITPLGESEVPVFDQSVTDFKESPADLGEAEKPEDFPRPPFFLPEQSPSLDVQETVVPSVPEETSPADEALPGLEVILPVGAEIPEDVIPSVPVLTSTSAILPDPEAGLVDLRVTVPQVTVPEVTLTSPPQPPQVLPRPARPWNAPQVGSGNGKVPGAMGLRIPPIDAVPDPQWTAFRKSAEQLYRNPASNRNQQSDHKYASKW